MTVQHISNLGTGFSLFACLILLSAYLFFLPDMRKNWVGKVCCCFLLLSLAALQWLHSLYFSNGTPLLETRSYGVLLTSIPPCFYLFSRTILSAEPEKSRFHWVDVAHSVPVLTALLLPISVLPPFAFLFGTGYTFWFTRQVLKMRGQSKRFKFELFFFAMFAVMALGALLLGLMLPKIDSSVFFIAYGNAISIALMLILSALLFFPELLSDILLASQLTYAKSRLEGVDIETKLKELDKLMVLDKQYQNEDLSLATLAELIDLNSHQLSEMINSQFGFGFPRYVREQRVNAAKKMLIKESNVSILAISMETGFKSQSNFYTAFKEITGMSPGKYRKTADL